MTLRIELARKHGPFDPRWLTARPLNEAERLAEAPPEAIAWPALQAWEGEGGAPLAEGWPGTRASIGARPPARVGAAVGPRLVFATARSPQPGT